MQGHSSSYGLLRTCLHTFYRSCLYQQCHVTSSEQLAGNADTKRHTDRKGCIHFQKGIISDVTKRQPSSLIMKSRFIRIIIPGIVYVQIRLGIKLIYFQVALEKIAFLQQCVADKDRRKSLSQANASSSAQSCHRIWYHHAVNTIF